ncbi:hypothetical protein IAT40_006781 [Kwoniella sp. CBS 6097]
MASPLPPPPLRPVLQVSRKQNIACDQCRSRKIRCLRETKAETCEQCSHRGAECTSNYIDSLAEAKAKKQRPRSSLTPTVNDATTAPPKKKKRKNSHNAHPHADVEQDQNGPPARRRSSATVISTYAVGESSQSGSFSADIGPVDSVDSLHMLAQAAPSQSVNLGTFGSHLSPGERQQNLLRYLFAPYPVTTMIYEYTDLSSIKCCKEGNDDLFEEDKGRIWAEQPSESHSALDDEAMRDLADDLIETFFSITHPRMPILLDADEFRSSFASPDTHPSGALSHSLLAVVLGWGARFSEHPVITSDRKEVSARDFMIAPGRKRSRLVSLVIIRTREVTEWNRITRLPSLENAQALYFLEGLLGRYQATYTSAVVRHLITLGYNTPRGLLSLQDENERTEAVFIWWAVVMTEGYKSACHRMKPSLYDEDFEFEDVQEPATHPSFPASGVSQESSPLGSYTNVSHWYNGCRQITSVFRSVSRALWIPKTAVTGIPITFLRDFIHRTSVWRDNHLSIIGAPAQWPESWDFQQAITACSIDCLYHVVWLIVNRTMEEFGIAEEKSAMGGGVVEIESIKRRIKEEAEHAALRIAALIGILTENGYLKLDPLIIHHTIYEAGLYLASRGRTEHLICIAGLRQYSLSFPALWDQADELESVYATATAAATACGHAHHLAAASNPTLSIGQAQAQAHHSPLESRRSSIPPPVSRPSSEVDPNVPCFSNPLGPLPSAHGTPSSIEFGTGSNNNNTPELVTPLLVLPSSASTSATLPVTDVFITTSPTGPLPLPAAASESTQYNGPFSRNSVQGLQLRQNGNAYYVDRGSGRSTSLPRTTTTATTTTSTDSNICLGHGKSETTSKVDGQEEGDTATDLPGVMFDWAVSSLGGA